MTRRLLDFDRATGLATWHEHDEATGETRLTYVQDVEPILEANKAAEKEAGGRMGELVHVASIPVSVQLKWLVEKGVDCLDPNHRDGVAKLLNDPEWRYLRVRNILL